MVVSVSDVVRAREQIAIASEELERTGQPHRADLPVGVMVETPASVMLIEDLMPHSDFVSVGTNDLIQYLLVADRTDGRNLEHYTLFHPAVLRSLDAVTRACRAAGTPLCLCGELAGFAGMTSLLLGLGFTTLSMNPSEIPSVKREIRGTHMSEAERLAAETLRMSLRGAIESRMEGGPEPESARARSSTIS
jgi:phosphoenolpyruvate-protein kinase (PTS system EI component)